MLPTTGSASEVDFSRRNDGSSARFRSYEAPRMVNPLQTNSLSEVYLAGSRGQPFASSLLQDWRRDRPLDRARSAPVMHTGNVRCEPLVEDSRPLHEH